MRYIKKKAALLLAAVLTASMAAAVSAEENADTGSEISVDISWEEMNFTYFGGHKIWDPETHTYSTASDMWYSLSARNIRDEQQRHTRYRAAGV